MHDNNATGYEQIRTTQELILNYDRGVSNSIVEGTRVFGVLEPKLLEQN